MKQLVELHGGSVTVRALGRSAFRVLRPLTPIHADIRSRPHHPTADLIWVELQRAGIVS